MSEPVTDDVLDTLRELAKEKLLMRGELSHGWNGDYFVLSFWAYTYWKILESGEEKLILLRCAFHANDHSLGIPGLYANEREPTVMLLPWSHVGSLINQWQKPWKDKAPVVFVENLSESSFRLVPQANLNVFVPILTIAQCLQAITILDPLQSRARDILCVYLQDFLKKNHERVHQVLGVL